MSSKTKKQTKKQTKKAKEKNENTIADQIKDYLNTVNPKLRYCCRIAIINTKSLLTQNHCQACGLCVAPYIEEMKTLGLKTS